MLSTDTGDYCNQWCLDQSKHHTHYREWNTIAIPEFLQGDGWSDMSYHNDACARSEYSLPNGEAIQVWVEHDAVEDREPDFSKYCVCILPDEDVGDEGIEVWHGEDATEAEAVVRRIMTEGK